MLRALWLALVLAASAATATEDLGPFVVVGSASSYQGFDLMAAGGRVAAIRFSSGGLISAAKLTTSTENGITLTFTGLQGRPDSGLTLGPDSRISISLPKGEEYPTISFRLSLRGFDEAKWRAAAGACPFHFLCLYMPDATLWHQAGWLNATPREDRFPLLIDPHNGSPELASSYSRDWSYASPMGAQPIPAIGLWAPERATYAGLEFQSTRLTDNTEKDLATAYCWRHGDAGQFVALVYPCGGKGYRDLLFPQPGLTLASHCTLIYSSKLPSTDDPNRLLWSYLWARYRDLLPQAPDANDLGWIPGADHERDLLGPAGPRLVGADTKGMTPDARFLIGWAQYREGFVDSIAGGANPEAVSAFTSDLRYVVGKLKRVTTGTGQAVLWPKPLEGAWGAAYGGKAANTNHSGEGWYVGRVLVDLYRHRDAPVIAGILRDVSLADDELLSIIQGVLAWSRSFAYTRADFADVPSSPFAIGGTLPIAFCLDYFYTFRSDPKHASDATQALALARTIAYRYLTMWISDNDRSDGLDSSFLWEPNSGRDWAGAACSNEVNWALETLAMVAVNSGDPVLTHALRGSLERWHLLYTDMYRPSIASYPHGSSMTEAYGLYDDSLLVKRGQRGAFGLSGPLPLLDPVGSAQVRALCGQSTALAFDRGEGHTQLTGYRCSPDSSFAFALSTLHEGDFDMVVTFPFVDLSKARVLLTRGGRTRELSGSAQIRRPPQAIWSLYLRNVRDGDQIVVAPTGQEAPQAVAAHATAATATQAGTPPNASPFTILSLSPTFPMKRDWTDTSSWAGLWTGLHVVYNVPYWIAERGGRLVASTSAVALAAPVVGPASIYLAYGGASGKPPRAEADDGTLLTPDLESVGLLWRAWPRPFTARLLGSVVRVPSGKRVVRLIPGDGPLFAASAIPDTGGARAVAEAALAGLRAAAAALHDDNADVAATQRLLSVGARANPAKVALLPPGFGGVPLHRYLWRAGLASAISNLTPASMVSSLSTSRYPVAMMLAGDDTYPQTARSPGDAADALVRYVRGGGFLVVASSAPYPLRRPIGSPPGTNEPLMPRLGVPLTAPSSPLAAGERLAVVAAPGQGVLPGLPARVLLPTSTPSVWVVDKTALPSDTRYTPICALRAVPGSNTAAAGRELGDAAALVEPRGEGGNRGAVLYVWSGLWSNPQLASALCDAVTEAVLERTTTGK